MTYDIATPAVDYVVLGQTVPEKRKSSGVVQVCSAGYSPTLRRLLRLYPLPVSLGGKRWHRYLVPVEHNPQDWRRESLRIAAPGRRESLDSVTDSLRLLEIQDRVKTLAELEARHLVAPSVAYLNDRRESLGLVEIDNVEGVWAENEEHAEAERDQLTLFNLPAKATGTKGTRAAYPVWSRLRFQDADGARDLMFNSWDIYEWLRKFGQDHSPESVWKNYKIGDSGYRHLALVGNILQYPNRWLVISLFHLPRVASKRAAPAGQLCLMEAF